MFKSVYHEACFYFSPFSGFLECVSTLLWRKHLHGLFNGCPRLWQISSCRASTSEVEVPLTISAFSPAVHSISCTRILTLSLFFLHKPPWLYCNSFQWPFPQYHVHSWAGNCWTRKPVGHFLVPGIWSPVLLSSSHSGNPAFKNAVSACFTFNIWRQWARSHFTHDSCHIHNWKETKHFVQGMVK